MKILVILTCYNRKEKTNKCISSIVNADTDVNFEFIVVDDNSNDGTVELLNSLKNEYNITLLAGNGKLYYSGGMRKGMLYALNNAAQNYEYVMLVNDDVDFKNNFLQSMVSKSKEKGDAVIVGATCDDDGNITYGAVKADGGKIKYRVVPLIVKNITCDTFNANCVLIPYKAFLQAGPMDSHFLHTAGDYDYGLTLSRMGYPIYTSNEYVGTCYKNSEQGTWHDTSLGIIKRIKLKEAPKGAPLKQWFYYLHKNYGLGTALVHGFTPYIRILLRK